MPYQSNLLGNLWTSYRQRRATGGRPLIAQEMRGLIDPLAAAESRKAIAAGERSRLQSNFNRQMELREKAYDDQARAAKVSGVTDLLGLGLQYDIGSRMVGGKGLGGLLGAANPGATGGGGANFLGLGGSVASTYTPASSVAGAGAEGFVPGLTGTTSALGPAALGVAGGLGGSALLQGLGVGKDVAESASYTAAGALAGSAIAPGVGTLIGGGIGLGVSLLDDIGDFFGGLF
jgi:hypothetical protein